ncbi:hypothetical protein CEXT_781021 [Caerostris extrusa]|uniref:Uncharacterized protein n=1 Tax=Caerostris extrusa TaxID=172846 RepID=A0AAV4TLA2_CAEEX|nr:hypothetical protein CEXT_781021 [Caerostris extrusa]
MLSNEGRERGTRGGRGKDTWGWGGGLLFIACVSVLPHNRFLRTLFSLLPVCMTKRRKSALCKTGTQSVAMVTNVIQRRKRRGTWGGREKDTRGGVSPLYRLLVRPSS